jgi:hypothetical protein
MSPYTCYPRLIFYPARETSEVQIHVVLVNSVQTFAAVEKRRVDQHLRPQELERRTESWRRNRPEQPVC